MGRRSPRCALNPLSHLGTDEGSRCPDRSSTTASSPTIRSAFSGPGTVVPSYQRFTWTRSTPSASATWASDGNARRADSSRRA